jgi:hypothetical protein
MSIWKSKISFEKKKIYDKKSLNKTYLLGLWGVVKLLIISLEKRLRTSIFLQVYAGKMV